MNRRPGARWVKARALLTLVVVGAVLVVVGSGVVSQVGKGITQASEGRTFSGTLGDAQQKFGDKAKVVKITDDGGGVDYDVLSPDHSMVLMRTYTVTTEQTTDQNGAPATGYTNHTEDSQRPAQPADLEAAAVTLGQLDRGLVERLWDRAGFPHSGSTATLDGSTWTIGSGARPFDKYQASFDGSGFHQIQSKSDVFGTTTSAPPPTSTPQGVPPAAAKRAAEVGKCLRRAHGDLDELKACVGQ